MLAALHGSGEFLLNLGEAEIEGLGEATLSLHELLEFAEFLLHAIELI